MRSGPPRYPVDRYLVESSKKYEMVNLTDDNIWNPEPALRPEDEIILRKLHDMLQSTADDLKLLSGELSKYHEPGVQIKTAPTPLDEEFNKKVHIEEVVNAKFHGYKVIDNNPFVPEDKPNVKDSVKSVNIKPKITNFGVQVNSVPVKPVRKHLSFSRPRVIDISENNRKVKNEIKLNNGKILNNMPKVVYNEFSYQYVDPIDKESRCNLAVQKMPSINIRSELKEQKVLHLDIIPEKIDEKNNVDCRKNFNVVCIQHDTISVPLFGQTKSYDNLTEPISKSKATLRRISKLPTCESSSGSNNLSSDAQKKLKVRRDIAVTRTYSQKKYEQNENKKKLSKNKQVIEKGKKSVLEEWKKKLNDVYGPSTSYKITTNVKTKTGNDISYKKSSTKLSKKLNNTDYIPYSKLTLGGVKVSDIEREISDIEDKKDIPLSPILNKIINSREHSFSRHENPNDNRKILTTSDENLLQEVIDIEKTVGETLSKNLIMKSNEPDIANISSESDNDKGSYADDFEEENSEDSENEKEKSPRSVHNTSTKHHTVTNETVNSDNPNSHKATYNKNNLSIKESVDIFEFIHSIDTQDIAIQSSTSKKITPKETQTSPRTDKQNIEPIHNDLWPSIDPRGDVEKLFLLEKDLIKKIIVEEYGDVLEKSINKPTTSINENSTIRNVVAVQRNTQTSPARVKSVMTSPRRTKTRTTSPLVNPSTDQQTSPIIVNTNESESKAADDISINLSSPRFSLRLPQNSRDVFSNLETSKDSSRVDLKSGKFKKPPSSTSSIDADNSSSELSSLGEVRFRLRKFRKRIPSICVSSNSSSKYSSDYETYNSIVPLKSEGEVSLQKINKRRVNKNISSEGEMNIVDLD